MTEESGAEYLLRKLNEQRESFAFKMIHGQVLNMEDYRRMQGVIQGIDFCVSLINAVQKEVEESNE